MRIGSELTAALLDVLSPPHCAACDQALSDSEQMFCGACAPLLEPRARGPATYAYGGPLADAIRRFKYGGHVELSRPLGALFAEAACARYAGRVDWVVPIPADRKRRGRRGYDPTHLLALPLAKALGARLGTRMLTRTRGGPAQASLERVARQNNVSGLYRARESVRGARLLLVDDVRTTGATLNAARQALLAKRPAKLFALAFAGVED